MVLFFFSNHPPKFCSRYATAHNKSISPISRAQYSDFLLQKMEKQIEYHDNEHYNLNVSFDSDDSFNMESIADTKSETNNIDNSITNLILVEPENIEQNQRNDFHPLQQDQ